MSYEQLGAIGKTALGVALVRAGETRRADRLFDDPFAEAFVTAAPGAIPEQRHGPHELAELGAVFSFQVVLRTRFFDDYLLAACAAGCRQVVLLAAGLDSRAFRLRWPHDVRLFELDLPAVLEFKGTVLAGIAADSHCERVVLPVDLREDWPATLIGSGFQAATATAWLAEGLLVYLSADEAARLLTSVGDLSAPGSRLAFERGDISDGSLLTRARQVPAMEQFTSLWKGGLGADAADWLTGHGWQTEIHDRASLAASYGRPAPHQTGGFLTAARLPSDR